MENQVAGEEKDINSEIEEPSVLLENFFKDFPDYEADKEKITAAWNYLLEKAAGVKRNCGKPWYLHPMRVARILAQNKLDSDSIISGFFHSILSLPGTSLDEIKSRFGEDVAKIVNGTTKITSLPINSKTLLQADSIRKMLFAMVDDVRVILVKLADRLDRMRNIKNADEKDRRIIAHEALDIWAPLADRLGISAGKNELEDLSLKYTNPDVFQQIKAIVSQKKDERSEYLNKATQAILKSAAKAGIEITITSRAKHFYSIYQKMRKRNKEPGELYDLLALRILCETDSECYTLVGIVHGLWKPLEGRFKDYIAMPKSNGYQSLHTTVMCEGKPLEIQIRTKKMHNIAEHGVASHWLYKKGTSHDLVDVKQLSIFNQLQELRNEHLDDETFFNEFKNELLGDEIVVFTPKGDVVKLPAGSTAIDFAYHIHSAVGEKIVGAKADGKIIPLSTKLSNTQIIEVLTNPQAHPTEAQIKLAKTSKARQRIHAWLTANDPVFIEKAAAKAAEIAERENAPKKQHKRGTGNGVQTANHSGKIKIGNTTNFVITIAKCCSPKYPDPIVGYISRARGITIHKASCLTYLRIPGIEKRSIEVIWDEETEQQKKPGDKK